MNTSSACQKESRILLDTAEKFSSKKVKTTESSQMGCVQHGKSRARATIGIWWNHGHKLNVSERVNRKSGARRA